jgi:hypothetical protein
VELEEGCCHGFVNSVILIPSSSRVLFPGRHLRSKLKEALPASKKHRALLNALSATFSPETIAEWTKMVEDWQEDTSAPNPFEEMALGMYSSSM